MPLPQIQTNQPDTGNFLNTMMQFKQYQDQTAYRENMLKAQNQNAAAESEKLALEKEEKLLKLGEHYLKQVTDKDDYQGYRQYMMEKGMNPQLLPEGFEDNAQFEDWKLKATVAAPELLKMKRGEKFWITDNGYKREVYPEDFKAIMEQTGGKGISLGVPIDQPNIDPYSPEGIQAKKDLEAYKAGLPKQGTAQRVFDKDGNLLFESGTGLQATSTMSKPTQNAIEKTVIDSGSALQRTREVLRKFEPQMLTYSGKIKGTYLNMKEKAGGNLTPDEKKYMDDLTGFRTAAVSNINQYIKDITGAALSEKEATRIRQGIADAGDGIFDGDGPTKFIGKIKESIHTATIAQTRAKLLLEKGIMLKTDSALERAESEYGESEVRRMIGEKAKQYDEKLKFENPAMPPEERKARALKYIKDNYGM